jgi:hypothetical protein
VRNPVRGRADQHVFHEVGVVGDNDEVVGVCGGVADDGVSRVSRDEVGVGLNAPLARSMRGLARRPSTPRTVSRAPTALQIESAQSSALSESRDPSIGASTLVKS